MLLEAGADPNVENFAGDTPLILAVDHFYDERSPDLSWEEDHAWRAISALVCHGARFDMSNRWGITPLSFAGCYIDHDYGDAPNLYGCFLASSAPKTLSADHRESIHTKVSTRRLLGSGGDFVMEEGYRAKY